MVCSVVLTPEKQLGIHEVLMKEPLAGFAELDNKSVPLNGVLKRSLYMMEFVANVKLDVKCSKASLLWA